MKESLQFGAGFCLVFLLFLTRDAIEATSIQVNGSDQEGVMMMPLTEEVERALATTGGLQRLKSFQVCALCSCCGGARGMCLPSPCCYGIRCNIPNRPFGFCSFTPKACNCFGCHT